MGSRGEVTLLLGQLNLGRKDALEMRDERPGHTLQPTARSTAPSSGSGGACCGRDDLAGGLARDGHVVPRNYRTRRIGDGAMDGAPER
jgi:hypothetical protein